MAKTTARHPPAFQTLALASLGTGFATYGVSAILILYLYAPSGVGLGFSRIAATQLMAAFTAVGYLAGMAGSYAADRLVGMRAPLWIGNGIKAVGIALLAVPHGGTTALYASLVLQTIGAGVAGQCLNALAGALYPAISPLRDAAFALLYITANVGAAAPLVTGTIALTWGYAAGFLSAAVVLVVSLLPYVWLQKRLFESLGVRPPAPLTPAERQRLGRQVLLATLVGTALVALSVAQRWLSAARLATGIGWLSLLLPVIASAAMLRSPQTTVPERRRIRYFSVYLVGNSICMMVYGQSTGILALYAAERVRLTWGGLHLTPAAFQTIPAVLAIVFGLAMSLAWAHLGRHQPSDGLKFGLGVLFWGLGPLFMAGPLAWFGPHTRVSPLWLVGFYVLIILGESLTAPIGTAMATRIAPVAFATQMVTVYALSQAAGAGLSALLVRWYLPGHEAAYFLGIGGLTSLYGLGLCYWHRRLEAGSLSGL
ncbi:peptide MFS transporter [Lacticaseibacillus daqingensis]|uniref:peptide MFS transporter n=1 Tax=Lacticaseibacillus daqingensis TaxID=2486014 RepID=UPI000F7A4D90|nr:oligopeptide:H+ symporter [Lacticaseibacillus daqingensis]